MLVSKTQARISKVVKSFIKESPFKDADGFRARFKGFKGTAVKAVDGETPTITNVDFQIIQDRFMNGVEILLNNHSWEDSVGFQIVDKDGIGVTAGWYTQGQFDAMGGEYMADDFGETWNVDPDKKSQGRIILPYPAKILEGLYIRLVYTATGTSNNVSVKINSYLHKQT